MREDHWKLLVSKVAGLVLVVTLRIRLHDVSGQTDVITNRMPIAVCVMGC